jgi:hypothetical protein
LELSLKEGKVIQNKPYCYQEIDGKRVEVTGSFKLLNPQAHNSELSTPNSQLYAYAFELTSYDSEYPLIIDPTLVYSTYLGGSNVDRPGDIAIDSLGNVYLTGWVYSPDFPVLGAIDANWNDGIITNRDDGFVTKLDPTGSALIYSTYLGGSKDERASGIVADSSGNAYITGSTRSNDFPTTPNSLKGSLSGVSSDGFITILGPNGNLIYSTYFGGSDFDSTDRVSLDDSGNVYVAGLTHSNDLTTTGGAYDTTFNGGIGDLYVYRWRRL